MSIPPMQMGVDQRSCVQKNEHARFLPASIGHASATGNLKDTWVETSCKSSIVQRSMIRLIFCFLLLWSSPGTARSMPQRERIGVPWTGEPKTSWPGMSKQHRESMVCAGEPRQPATQIRPRVQTRSLEIRRRGLFLPSVWVLSVPLRSRVIVNGKILPFTKAGVLDGALNTTTDNFSAPSGIH